MVTTSPDNIWSPDSGDDYALTTDLAGMADTVQDAITANRVGRIGTNAQRLALTGTDLFEGLTFRTTDTRRDWVYTGGAWVQRMAPFAVAGGVATVGTGVTTISFPSGVFTRAPEVLQVTPLVPTGGQVGTPHVGENPTAASFKCRIFNQGGSSIGGTVSWLAMQMTG